MLWTDLKIQNNFCNIADQNPRLQQVPYGRGKKNCKYQKSIYSFIIWARDLKISENVPFAVLTTLNIWI